MGVIINTAWVRVQKASRFLPRLRLIVDLVMAPITIPPSQTALSHPELKDVSIIRVRDTINQIRLLTNRILDLRVQSQGSNEDESPILATEQKKLTNLKIMLRGFNREMYLENRAVKAETSEAKAEVDNLYLNLQNLKYEQQHLRSEIQDCRNYVYRARNQVGERGH